MSTAARFPSFVAGGNAGVSRGRPGRVSPDSPRFKFKGLNASFRRGEYHHFPTRFLRPVSNYPVMSLPVRLPGPSRFVSTATFPRNAPSHTTQGRSSTYHWPTFRVLGQSTETLVDRIAKGGARDPQSFS